MKVIATEHLRGGRGVEVFYTTETDADAETSLRRFSWRWPIEVTPSFAEMLAALRTERLEKQEESDFSTPASPASVKKLFEPLKGLFQLAA